MINVLSLCDGKAGFKTALKELNVPCKYHAIELNKYARLLADSNYPGEINRPFNDVNDITEKWIQENGPFDWIVFGSDCATVSNAGNQTGLNGKSGLIIQCVKVMRWVLKYNPDCKYLIENVKMSKKFYDQFCGIIGHDAVLINSALVSAQNRQRYYWCNFPVSQPQDRKIVIEDILEDDFLSNRDKSYAIDANYAKGANPDQYANKSRRQLVFGWSKSSRYIGDDGKIHSKKLNPDGSTREVYIENRVTDQGKSNTLLTGEGCAGQSTSNFVVNLPHGFNKGNISNTKTNALTKSSWEQNNFVVQLNKDKSCGGKQPHMQDRIYSKSSKSAALTASFASRLNVGIDEITYRKLSVRECARLQTIPEWFSFESVSKTQAYKAIGMGWTNLIIQHIFLEAQK